jgi:hypothetical protein
MGERRERGGDRLSWSVMEMMMLAGIQWEFMEMVMMMREMLLKMYVHPRPFLCDSISIPSALPHTYSSHLSTFFYPPILPPLPRNPHMSAQAHETPNKSHRQTPQQLSSTHPTHS